VLAERVFPRKHVLDGAAQPRHLQVSGRRGSGKQLAPAPDLRLFSGALRGSSLGTFLNTGAAGTPLLSSKK